MYDPIRVLLVIQGIVPSQPNGHAAGRILDYCWVHAGIVLGMFVFNVCQLQYTFTCTRAFIYVASQTVVTTLAHTISI